jgi:hypothetical protein
MLMGHGCVQRKGCAADPASISHPSFHRASASEADETPGLMRLIDKQHPEMPWYN